MPCQVWGELTYPIPNFSNRWNLGMDKKFHFIFKDSNCDRDISKLIELSLIILSGQTDTKPVETQKIDWIGKLFVTEHSAADTVKTHYMDLIMGAMTSQITSLTIVDSTIYSDADQRKHQSSASLAFVRGIHQSPVNTPHKWSATRKMFPFNDVIMSRAYVGVISGKFRYGIGRFDTDRRHRT